MCQQKVLNTLFGLKIPLQMEYKIEIFTPILNELMNIFKGKTPKQRLIIETKK